MPNIYVGENLPLELVLDILELAARDLVHQRSAWVASLCTVSVAVRDVLRPVLYSVLTVDSNNLLDIIDIRTGVLRADLKFSEFTRQLVIGPDELGRSLVSTQYPSLLNILRQCPNLRSLILAAETLFGLWHAAASDSEPSHPGGLTGDKITPVRTVYEVVVTSIFDGGVRAPASFAVALFSEVTHLTISAHLLLYSIQDLITHPPVQRHLPWNLLRLTHVIFDVNVDAPEFMWVTHFPILWLHLDLFLRAPSVKRLLVRPYIRTVCDTDEFCERMREGAMGLREPRLWLDAATWASEEVSWDTQKLVQLHTRLGHSLYFRGEQLYIPPVSSVRLTTRTYHSFTTTDIWTLSCAGITMSTTLPARASIPVDTTRFVRRRSIPSQ